MHKFLLSLLFACLMIPLHAQEISPLEGTFYQSAKFYVVIAVVAVILLGIFLYLVRLDRKISKLENE